MQITCDLSYHGKQLASRQRSADPEVEMRVNLPFSPGDFAAGKAARP